MVINPFKRFSIILKFKKICKSNKLFIYDTNKSLFDYSCKLDSTDKSIIKLFLHINWFNNEIDLSEFEIEKIYNYNPIELRKRLTVSNNSVIFNINNEGLIALNDYINSYLIINKLSI